jgi:hypothetical protein
VSEEGVLRVSGEGAMFGEIEDPEDKSSKSDKSFPLVAVGTLGLKLENPLNRERELKEVLLCWLLLKLFVKLLGLLN